MDANYTVKSFTKDSNEPTIHGTYDDFEEANESALEVLRDHFLSLDELDPEFLERWIEDEIITYLENGCLWMDLFPEEGDEPPIRVVVEKSTAHDMKPGAAKESTDFVYTVTSYLLDKESGVFDPAVEGTYTDLEAANEAAIDILHDHYDSGDADVVEESLDDGLIFYNDDGCLWMDESPENTKADPLKVCVTKGVDQRKQKLPNKRALEVEDDDEDEDDEPPAKRAATSTGANPWVQVQTITLYQFCAKSTILTIDRETGDRKPEEKIDRQLFTKRKDALRAFFDEACNIDLAGAMDCYSEEAWDEFDEDIDGTSVQVTGVVEPYKGEFELDYKLDPTCGYPRWTDEVPDEDDEDDEEEAGDVESKERRCCEFWVEPKEVEVVVREKDGRSEVLILTPLEAKGWKGDVEELMPLLRTSGTTKENAVVLD